MSKKQKQFCRDLNYIDHLLIVISLECESSRKSHMEENK